MIIWLISYPRSGNTLVRSIFKHYFDLNSLSIYGDSSDIAANPELSKLVGHKNGDIETVNLDILRAGKEPAIIKTHDGPNSLMSGDDILVHIIRDGRDAVLSYFHYSRDIAGRPDVTLSEVIAGRVKFGLWGYHTTRWLLHEKNRVFRFHFEDIVKDKSGFAHEISKVVKRSPSSTPFPEITKFKAAAPSFVRSGEVGGWKNEFSNLHVSLFQHYNGTAMNLAGYGGDKPTTEQANAYMTFGKDIESERSLSFATTQERNRVIKERDDVIKQRDDVTKQRDDVTKQRDDAIKQRDDLIKQRDDVIKERDDIIQERENVKRALHETDTEFSELQKKFAYLENKEIKRIRRINKAKSIFGIKPHRLPWDHS